MTTVPAVPAADGWIPFSGVTTNVGTVSSFYATLTMPGGATYFDAIYVDDLSWK